ncbi:hypothetical protein E1J38_013720 [Seonamhaeicola sediminis]|uniref:DUF5362 domain-containing protein n=1 Tax=Seonamhaeicola sediminis TaxID=2528206 RepID=A0A562YAT0_9FLAO|nr:DUF5362 family protein [Seonamhaeicola sediminis]TWO31468.1 hypothetical protein E1J38_013720 [Seonamhaeicola sediminis]
MEEKSAFESFELGVNQEIKGYLEEISKWSYFLSILGFVGIGFMVFGGIAVAITGAASSGLDGFYGTGYTTGMALFYILLALLYFFPVLYLFKFSKNMKSALRLTNGQDFKVAFSNLKSHYKFIGIFTIVIISLYILVLIGVATGAALF